MNLSYSKTSVEYDTGVYKHTFHTFYEGLESTNLVTLVFIELDDTQTEIQLLTYLTYRDSYEDFYNSFTHIVNEEFDLYTYLLLPSEVVEQNRFIFDSIVKDYNLIENGYYRQEIAWL